MKVDCGKEGWQTKCWRDTLHLVKYLFNTHSPPTKHTHIDCLTLIHFPIRERERNCQGFLFLKLTWNSNKPLSCLDLRYPYNVHRMYTFLLPTIVLYSTYVLIPTSPSRNNTHQTFVQSVVGPHTHKQHSHLLLNVTEVR